MSVLKTPIDAAFEQFASECSGVKIIRQEMIEKLRKQIAVINVDTEKDQARTLEVKLQVFNTLDGLLKSVEASSERNVKLNMARKDAENNEQVAASITELIKSIHNVGCSTSSNDSNINREQVTNAIADKADKLGITISEGELTECGSKPSGDLARPADEVKEES